MTGLSSVLKWVVSAGVVLAAASGCGLLDPTVMTVRIRPSSTPAPPEEVPTLIAADRGLSEKYNQVTSRMDREDAARLDAILGNLAAVLPPQAGGTTATLQSLLDMVDAVSRGAAAGRAMERLKELSGLLGQGFVGVISAGKALDAAQVDAFAADLMFLCATFPNSTGVLGSLVARAPVSALPGLVSGVAQLAQDNAEQGLLLLSAEEEAARTFGAGTLSAFAAAAEADLTRWAQGVAVARRVPVADEVQDGLLRQLAGASSELALALVDLSASYADQAHSDALSRTVADFLAACGSFSASTRLVAVDELSAWLAQGNAVQTIALATAVLRKLSANSGADAAVNESRFLDAVEFAGRIRVLAQAQILSESEETALLTAWEGTTFGASTFPGGTIAVSPDVSASPVLIVSGGGMSASGEGAGFYAISGTTCPANQGTFSVSPMTGQVTFVVGAGYVTGLTCDVTVSHHMGIAGSAWVGSQLVRVAFPADAPVPTLSIAAPTSTLVNLSGSVAYGLTYTHAQSVSLTTGRLSLVTTGDASCSGLAVSGGTSASPSVTLSGCTGNGTVRLAVSGGAALNSQGVSDAGSTAGNAFTVDNQGPTVTIGAPSVAIIDSDDAVTFGVTYADANSVNLTNGDVSLSATGGVACSNVVVTDGSTASPVVSVSGCTGNGTVRISIAAGTSQDAAGNDDTGAGPGDAVDVGDEVTLEPVAAKTIRRGQKVTFQLSATSALGLPLTFEFVESSPAGLTPVLNASTGVVEWSPVVADAPGLYDFTFVARTASGVSDPQTATVELLVGWSTPLVLGSTGDENPMSFLMGPDGYSYVHVKTASASFLGQAQIGGNDCSLVKLDPDGSVVWARRYGSTNNDDCGGMAVDGAGNVYATGTTGGAMDGVALVGGALDVFITKYAVDGTRVWTKLYGSGATTEFGRALIINSVGEIFLMAATTGTVAGEEHFGNADIVVMKFSPANGAPIWAQAYGGGGLDTNYGAVGFFADRYLFIPGSTLSASFSGTATNTSTALNAMKTFLIKVDLNNNGSLEWVRIIDQANTTVQSGKNVQNYGLAMHVIPGTPDTAQIAISVAIGDADIGVTYEGLTTTRTGSDTAVFVFDDAGTLLHRNLFESELGRSLSRPRLCSRQGGGFWFVEQEAVGAFAVSRLRALNGQGGTVTNLGTYGADTQNTKPQLLNCLSGDGFLLMSQSSDPSLDVPGGNGNDTVFSLFDRNGALWD